MATRLSLRLPNVSSAAFRYTTLSTRTPMKWFVRLAKKLPKTRRRPLKTPALKWLKSVQFLPVRARRASAVSATAATLPPRRWCSWVRPSALSQPKPLVNRVHSLRFVPSTRVVWQRMLRQMLLSSRNMMQGSSSMVCVPYRLLTRAERLISTARW